MVPTSPARYLMFAILLVRSFHLLSFSSNFQRWTRIHPELLNCLEPMYLFIRSLLSSLLFLPRLFLVFFSFLRCTKFPSLSRPYIRSTSPNSSREAFSNMPYKFLLTLRTTFQDVHSTLQNVFCAVERTPHYHFALTGLERSVCRLSAFHTFQGE